VLGLVGGLSGIIWSLLELCLKSYDNFTLEKNVFEDVYGTSPDDGSAPSNDKEAKLALARTVVKQSTYSYSYFEYWLTKYVKLLLGPCCRGKRAFDRRVDRFTRHKEASDRLSGEMDIARVVKSLRVVEFLARVVLNKHQRALIPKLKKH